VDAQATGVAPVGLFDDHERRADRVRALDEQRMLLRALQADVLSALNHLAPAAGLHWRSASARRYAEQREQLRDEVRRLLWAIDEAANEVGVALSALAGGE